MVHRGCSTFALSSRKYVQPAIWTAPTAPKKDEGHGAGAAGQVSLRMVKQPDLARLGRRGLGWEERWGGTSLTLVGG